MRLAAKKSIAQTVRLTRSLAARVRVGIIRAEYNSDITLSLEKKCGETLLKAGIRARNIRHFRVPGCFEVPFLARRLAAQKRFDALIALGAVIRGDTYHFDLVANECARGVMEVSLKYDVPIIFEVLATYNRRDALRRAGDNQLNKGIEAAHTVLSLLGTLS
jgi:6,7-dimethyl-8-ribityllumazine synthase